MIKDLDVKELSKNLLEVLLKNKIPVIDKDKISKEKVIGEGSFGKVYKGKYGEREVAIKKIKLIQLPNYDEIMHEIQAVMKFSHEQIPKFYGVWKTDKYLHLVFDFINGVTLKEWFKMEGRTDKEKIDAMIQLVEIIENMHSFNIIHRDLKPENIMIMDKRVYVIDFGVSKIAQHTQTFTNNQRGTVAYFGPENCNINTDKDSDNIIAINTKFDIWSIACIISFIFSNQPPWAKEKKKKKPDNKEEKGKESEVENSKEQIEEKRTDKKEKEYEILKDYHIIGNLTKKVKFPIPRAVPQPLHDILKLCFEYNPNDRIRASELAIKLREYDQTQI